MRRSSFDVNGLNLSYLDSGGGGRALIALHAHWMEGQTWAVLAGALGPAWRVIALDQRGHGYSDHAASYTRGDYLGDLKGLFAHLGLERAVLLGNSLGGVNAYQFAAREPARVRGLIVEDIGAVIADDTSFSLPWAGTFKTRGELEERLGPRMLPYLKDSFRSDAEGWRLAFDPVEMTRSQAALNGDHWDDWLSSSCPALLVRGRDSRVTQQEHFEEMARRRPHTVLRCLEGGHVVHQDTPEGFAGAVREFLEGLGK